MLDKTLDVVRMALYAALVAVVFLLFQAWQSTHQPTASVTPAASLTPEHFIPTVASAAASAPANAASAIAAPTPTEAPSEIVTVSTDLLNIKIDTLGGEVIESQLLDYPESLHADTPFVLLNNDSKTRYIAESGLVSQQGPDLPQAQAHYTTTHSNYALAPDQQELVVALHWEKNNIKVTKSFIFERGSYEVKVKYDIDNQSTAAWQGNLYTQLMRTNTPPVTKGGIVNLSTYFGAAISTPNKPFDKITFKQMHEKPVEVQSPDGWAAMIQHYFISAWVPPSKTTSTYYSKVTDNGLYTIGMMGQEINVAPGTKNSVETKLYTGPAIADLLEKTAPGLKLTIDYGWFWFISAIIFWMMQKIYDVVGNWGWSIVLVTIIIKLLFYRLSAKSYRSMSTLKKLQPRIEALKERYGDDKQKLTQATLELYRQEKVNPMSGCLPILVQIPVFIALYWVLVESVQLRQAPFILWIHDLSQHDPYYVLPIMMGISMFIQQRLNPPPADPMQAKMMMLMPLIFTFLFANFPAGLMLYWFVNNTLSFAQQWYIMRKVNHTHGKAK